MKKALFVLLGVTALILGILGIILPILPTTPLLLLALYCFTKGAEKLNLWFQKTSLYKKYLSEYVQTKSLTLKQKLSAQFFSGGIIVVSFICLDNWVLKIILGFCFIIHNWTFLLKIKTRKSCKQYTSKNVKGTK